MLPRGYIHIYTGNGKGKTSAALGLAFRASGSGLRTIVIQFMKGLPTGELEAASKTGGLVTIERYGSRRFCRPDDDSFEEHRKYTIEGYERARQIIADALYDIVILDEIITAATFKLLTDSDILALCDSLHENTELVMTGRGASDALIGRADLVTEMREIKHYYRAGVAPRRGIED
ncbi:MAG: cob(I)yrinic acid a,c-diamide adenosyltransferase [Spirochaetes bacterium]|nr:cob(I)yrinic acid a,c-diamide adenosyltransferase [Spirochaetota bacterium]